MSLIRSGGIRLKTAALDSFSAAGEAGKAYARSVQVTLAAGAVYSVKLQKNSNVAVRFARADGLYIEAVYGDITGSILSLNEFVTTNGVFASDFVGSFEVHAGPAAGDILFGSMNELSDSFYPDGQMVIQITNNTELSITTSLSIGVEQISGAGIYSILEPDTQLNANTEMSDYNGLN